MSNQRAVTGGDAALRGHTRSKRRRQVESDKSTAQLILDEAKAIVARAGVDGLRLSAVSERLGVTVPAIYAHFPRGRSEILERIALLAIEGLASFFPASEGTDPGRALELGTRGVVRFLYENPAYLRLLLRDLSMPPGLPELTRQIGPPGAVEKIGMARAMHQRIERLLNAVAKDTSVIPPSAPAFFNALFGAACLNIVHPPDTLEAGNTCRQLEDLVVELASRYAGLPPRNKAS
jgi:AcrR family transcriptional regulator